MPSLHRRLVHRHAERILSSKPRDLAPGEARLYSYYAPSLTGGLHNISVSQTITAPAEPSSNSSARREIEIDSLSQSFLVIAPRFSLPPGIVDSVYPTPGISAEHTILPHIVLKDPHLPWSRAPSHFHKEEDENNVRSRSTWLALMVFSIDELQLTEAQIKNVLQKMGPDVKREQSETFSLRIYAKNTLNLNGIDRVVNTTGFNVKLDSREAAEASEVVLLPGKLFTDLFVEPGGPKDELNVSAYKHMAHVRQVATDGMANAGAEHDEALFSVVVSRRTGPIGADTPSMMIVHLLSLSWDIKMPIPKDDDRVAVTSLHSWTYTCLPSKNTASSFDMLINLGDHLTVMRTDDVQKSTGVCADYKEDSNDDTAVTALIAARQRDGYIIARHRTVTGEVTAAILHGPLVPTQVDRPFSANMFMQSNFGHDLAIFDPKLGLLDTTYSNAWQLGRTLAMTDNAFCAALARLRNAVQSTGLDAAKREVHAFFGDDGYGSRQRSAGKMLGLVQGLNRVNNSLHEQGGAATAVGENRWCYDFKDERIGLESIDLLSQDSPHISMRLATHSNAAAMRFAMAVKTVGDEVQEAKEKDEEEEAVLYNEHNIPSNPDYAVVYSWVLDKLHLANIPAHYLIPDPDFLPQETLRFFYLDANWTDALVDGGLSLANHWGAAPEKDASRIAIKKSINKRLMTPDDKLGGWHVQVPRYGFLIRSQLLVQFPDIAIDVKFAERRSQPLNPLKAKMVVPPANTPAQQPILVQKRIAPDTMYLLFDAAPPDLRRITFTLPSHQQSFKIGQTLTDKSLKVMLKKLYTTITRPDGAQPGDTLCNVEFSPDGKPVFAFDWGTRTLNPTVFGQYLVDQLRAKNKDYFTDEIPTSAVTALQLNSSILQLDIGDISARCKSEPIPLFQLSTPPQKNQTPPPLKISARSTVPAGFKIRPHRPESPTRDFQLLTQFHESQRLKSQQNDLLSTSPTPPISPFDVPSLELNVYSVRSITREYIQSDADHTIDLIFSLRRKDKNQWFQKLTRIFVGVPVGDMPKDGDSKSIIPLLSRTADPPTPVMLSNMRLNVLKRWGSDDEKEFKGHLVFELVPREQPGMEVRLLEDASFRLPRADIAYYDGTKLKSAWVKVLYEFLNNKGVPERHSQQNGQLVYMRGGSSK